MLRRMPQRIHGRRGQRIMRRTDNRVRVSVSQGIAYLLRFDGYRCDLELTTTDDTITPALQAFEVIAEYDGEISVGTISLDGAKYFRNPSFESHLRAIQQIVASRNAELRVNDSYELDISRSFRGYDTRRHVYSR